MNHNHWPIKEVIFDKENVVSLWLLKLAVLSDPSANGAHGIKLLFQLLNVVCCAGDNLDKASATWAAVVVKSCLAWSLKPEVAFLMTSGRFGIFGSEGVVILGRLGSVTFGNVTFGSVTFGNLS